MSGIGLEHQRSSENGVGTGYFTDWKEKAGFTDLLPHEYTHSWNGKYRRGADLWTPNYNVPMQDSLLWVYEGQTQYRSEEHTSELQSLMRISYAVFCLKKKTQKQETKTTK